MRNLFRSTLVLLFIGAIVAPLRAQDIRPLHSSPQRHGFFLGLGIAGGTYDNECDLCAPADPASAGGLHLKLGGTLSSHVRLGADILAIGTNSGQFVALSGSPNTVTEAVADVTVSAWIYPRSAGNFWLQGGLGGVAYVADVQNDQKYTASSNGAILGLGYDFRVGRTGSFTPYLRWVGSGEGKLKDANGDDVGPAKWKTKYWAFGLDYVFH